MSILKTMLRKGLLLAIVAISISLTSVTAFEEAFAESITFTSSKNNFSITVDDWWDVDDYYDSTEFRGINGSTEIGLLVTKSEGVFSLKDMDAVEFLTSVVDDNLDNARIHNYDNYGIVTIDGKKAYQVSATGTSMGEQCSMTVSVVPDDYYFWILVGQACGKAHDPWNEDLKKYSKTFVTIDTTISKSTSNSYEMSILPYSYRANCDTDSCFDNPNISINVGESVIIWNEDIVSHEIVSGTPMYGPEFLFDTVILESGEGYEIEFSSSGRYDFFSNLYPWISSSIFVGDVQTSKSNVFSVPELDYFYESDTGNFEIALPYSWPVDEIDSKHISFLDFDNMGIQGIVSYMGKDKGFNSKSDSELNKWFVDYVKSDCSSSCKIKNMVEEPTLTNYAENNKRFIGGYTSEQNFFGVNQEVQKMSILHLINDESWIIDLYVAMDTPKEYHSDFFLQILSNFEPIPTSKNYMNFEEIQKSKLNSIQKSKIPEWIKNNAEWWSEGLVDDSTFSQGIGFLIKNKVISVSSFPPQASAVVEEKIPGWIKNNAKWWADGMISEDDFLKGITYMVEKGIIRAQ